MDKKIALLVALVFTYVTAQRVAAPQQQCTSFSNVVIPDWRVSVAYTELQKGVTFNKTMPPLFSTACNVKYSVMQIEDRNAPGFIKQDFKNSRLVFGSLIAVEIFGIDALYAKYNLIYSGHSSTGATISASFVLQFVNPVKSGWSQREAMGVLLYLKYKQENPSVWDDGFPEQPHNEVPYGAGPFRHGSTPIIFIQEQMQQRIRLEYRLRNYQKFNPISQENANFEYLDGRYNKVFDIYNWSKQKIDGLSGANLLKQIAIPSIKSMSTSGYLQIQFTNEILYSKIEFPLLVNQNSNENISVDEYFLRYLKDTGSIQVLILPSSPLYIDQLEYSWKVISMSKVNIEIQIDFNQTVFPSSGFDPDRIQISFFNTRNWMITDNKYKLSIPNGYFIQYVIPPQVSGVLMQPPVIFEYIGSVYVVLNLVFQNYWPMQDVWSMINSFQITSHLPLLKIPLPNTALIWFQTFRKISCFQYFSDDLMYEKNDFSITDSWSKNFEFFNIKTSNFMLLFGSHWVYYLVLIVHGLLIACLYMTGFREEMILEMNVYLVGAVIRFTSFDFWISAALLLMIETFYELIFDAIIGLRFFGQIHAISFSKQDWVSISINFFIWGCILTFLACTFWFYYSVTNSQKLKSQSNLTSGFVSPRMMAFASPRFTDASQKAQSWTQKYLSKITNKVYPDKLIVQAKAQIYQNFNREIKAEKKHASLFIPLFIFRRLILCIIALFAQDYPWLQIHLFLIISGMSLAFLIIVKPFQSQEIFIYECLNEVAVLWFGFCCLGQLTVQNNSYARLYIGYFIEQSLVAQLLVNMIAMIVIRLIHMGKWSRVKIAWELHFARLRRKERERIAAEKKRLEEEERQREIEEEEERKRKLNEAMKKQIKQPEKGKKQPEKAKVKLRRQKTYDSEISLETIQSGLSKDQMSEMTEEEESQIEVPEELEEFKVKVENNKLYELMKKKIEDEKAAIEREQILKQIEADQIIKQKAIKHLKDDNKINLDRLFEDLYEHIKTFA